MGNRQGMSRILRSLISLSQVRRHQAPVVQKVDSAIHWINLYPVDNPIGFPNTYPLDSDLSSGKRYPPFEQLGPGVAQANGYIFHRPVQPYWLFLLLIIM